jgi:hypothetical protein
MRILVAVFAFWAVAATAHPQPLADPLAPAREGMVACYSPITEGRTCRAIHTYVFNADDTATSVATASLQQAPSIVMRIRSTVSSRDGLVCGPQGASNVEAATFEIDGVPASLEQTQELRDAMRAALASRFGELCSTFSRTGETISVASLLDGRRLPNVNTMIWVRPTDGYVLRGP